MLSDYTIKFMKIYKTAVAFAVRQFLIIFPQIFVSKVNIFRINFIYETYNIIMV